MNADDLLIELDCDLSGPQNEMVDDLTVNGCYRFNARWNETSSFSEPKRVLQMNSDQKFFKRKKSMMLNEIVKEKQLEKTQQKMLVGEFHFYPSFNEQVFPWS